MPVTFPEVQSEMLVSFTLLLVFFGFDWFRLNLFSYIGATYSAGALGLW